MAGPVEFAPSTQLSDALVILGAAGIVIPLFARFRITPIIGFILVGIAVGPFGLGGQVASNPWLAHVTISDPHSLEIFAEFGIVLLLFSVGLELSFERLWAMRRAVFGVGALELIGAALLIAAGLMALGNSAPAALALGLALALSSTALVLRITDTRTPVGHAALSMLLFEDIALVPIVFLLGAMGHGSGEQNAQELLRVIGMGGLVIAILLVLGRYALPILFAQAARTKSPELFLAASLLVVIAASLATSSAGLSPIVGALIAGLLIAETQYHGEVEAITEPFKGLALGIFLITVGMGLDLNRLVQQPGEILLAVALVLVAKALVTGLLMRVMGARPGTSIEAGILMSSPSETTLIVLTAAIAARLINAEAAQFWQLVTAIGLTITPMLAWLGKRAARRFDGAAPGTADQTPEVPHAIIVGFGRVGRLVADMLAMHEIPYIAVDSNADLVADARIKGYRANFGDAGRVETLSRLGIGNATAIILTMDEPVAAQRMVRKLRSQHPDLPIIARARDASHAAQLYRAGASHAVPEALEASLQLSEAVLVDLGVAMGPVIVSIHEKRDEMRAQIMEEGDLGEMPKLKSSALAESGG